MTAEGYFPSATAVTIRLNSLGLLFGGTEEWNRVSSLMVGQIGVPIGLSVQLQRYVFVGSVNNILKIVACELVLR